MNREKMRWGVWMTVVLLLISAYLPVFAARAESEPDVPSDVLEYFSKDDYWRMWDVVTWLTPCAPEKAEGSTDEAQEGFALLSMGENYDLALFCLGDSGWEFEYNNPSALPSSSEKYTLRDCTEEKYDIEVSAPGARTLHFTKTFDYEWKLYDNWKLFYISLPDLSIDMEESGVARYSGKNTEVTAVEGIGPYWLLNYRFSGIPLSPEAALLSLKPVDPVTLSGKAGAFPRNQMYDVYQGPGEEYGRAGNGKARVSTNGEITCFGIWCNALLIRYDTSQGKRMGWVLLSDLPEDVVESQEDLCFDAFETELDSRSFLYGVLTEETAVLSDAEEHAQQVNVLPAGTSVHCLAKFQDMLLIEGYNREYQIVMGFVPLASVDREKGYASQVVRKVDAAVTDDRAEIEDAMDAVETYVVDSFQGDSLLSLTYEESENADTNAWWRDTENGYDSILLYADINSMRMTDYETAWLGFARDYNFILYKMPQTGWQVVNHGYE